MKKNRPLGISLLSALYMLASALIIIMGLMITLLGGMFSVQDLEDQLGTEFVQMFGNIFTVFGVIIIIIGVLFFMLGLGLWKLSFLAWVIAIILHGLSTLSVVLNYQMYLDLLATSGVSTLIQPIITVVVFIYLIIVRDVFK